MDAVKRLVIKDPSQVSGQENKIDYAAKDATDAIDGRLSGKLFYKRHEA